MVLLVFCPETTHDRQMMLFYHKAINVLFNLTAKSKH